MVDLDSHHTEVERLGLLVVVVVPRLALVLVVVVPRLALVLVDTHTDPADLHMHEEEEDTVDNVLWLWRISSPRWRIATATTPISWRWRRRLIMVHRTLRWWWWSAGATDPGSNAIALWAHQSITCIL